MLVRRMKQEDIPSVCQIEEQSFSDPWTQKMFEDSLASGDQIYFVAEENGIIGFLGMYLCQEEADIINVAVDKTRRGLGVGRILVERAQQELREAQGERIFLEVRVSNDAAIALYTKCGFEKVGVRKNYYKNPTEDAHVMCWEQSE